MQMKHSLTYFSLFHLMAIYYFFSLSFFNRLFSIEFNIQTVLSYLIKKNPNDSRRVIMSLTDISRFIN